MTKAIAACAVSVLATVFSVQQGEYGPLVVYKLQVPPSAGPVVPAAEPFPAPSADEETYVIPSRAPKVLGTVVMPASALEAPETAYPPAPVPDEVTARPTELPLAVADPLPDIDPRVPTPAAVIRIVEQAAGVQPMVNETTGGALTLKAVNDEVFWRHNTAEKLRQVPAMPRF